MREITRVSDITFEDVAEYIRLNEVTSDDENTLKTFITVAKAYIEQYTGRSEEELDNYRDFVIVTLILCQDMWDNRALYVDGSHAVSINHVVDSILSLHSVNLL